MQKRLKLAQKFKRAVAPSLNLQLQQIVGLLPNLPNLPNLPSFSNNNGADGAQLFLTLDAVIWEYCQFMAMKALYEDWNATRFSPSLLVDKVWHTHLLDTRSYYGNCMKIFGNIIHHNPMGGINEKAQMLRYVNTLELGKGTGRNLGSLEPLESLKETWAAIFKGTEEGFKAADIKDGFKVNEGFKGTFGPLLEPQECVVCLDSAAVMCMTPCLHKVLCKNCLRDISLLSSPVTCPICKTDSDEIVELPATITRVIIVPIESNNGKSISYMVGLKEWDSQEAFKNAIVMSTGSKMAKILEKPRGFEGYKNIASNTTLEQAVSGGSSFAETDGTFFKVYLVSSDNLIVKKGSSHTSFKEILTLEELVQYVSINGTAVNPDDCVLATTLLEKSVSEISLSELKSVSELKFTGIRSAMEKRVAEIEDKKLTLFVKSMNGQTTTIRAFPIEHILCVKARIAAVTGVSTCIQRIIYAGHNLSDDHSLADYNIMDSSTLHLVLTLKGC